MSDGPRLTWSLIAATLLACGGGDVARVIPEPEGAVPQVSAEPPISDPTRPPGGRSRPSAPAADEKERSPLVLQSVIISPQRRVAVINGRTVRLGDDVGGATVKEIAHGSVRLEGPAGPITLALVRGIKRAPGERR